MDQLPGYQGRLIGRPMFLGAVVGNVSASGTALAFLLLIPEAGFGYWELRALPSLATWAFFLGWPIGLAVGVACGAVIGAYSGRLVSSMSRHVFALCVALVAVAVTQLMIPVAWELPRLKVGLVVALAAFAFARLSIYIVIAYKR